MTYRLLTGVTAPLVPPLLRWRAAKGKEDPARVHERLGKRLPTRPGGQLVWCHGASVGESLMLDGFTERLRAERPGLTILFTSQTRTAADIMAGRLQSPHRHCYAPVDTPGATARFIRHWQPDAAVFAEGEIWPNLLMEARRHGVPMALINARTTARSLKGWSRFRGAARVLFGSFRHILAADDPTADGLGQLLGRTVHAPGNLKSALPPPPPEGEVPEALSEAPAVILAASTHAGEEALIHTAWAALPEPRPALVIAPRHPGRAQTIRDALEAEGACVRQRSLSEIPARGDVYLADTMGEMGLWYALADLVYLGGGHVSGVGGHNPMEPLRYGKPVLTGPDLFNFQTVRDPLVASGGLTIAATADALTGHLADHFSGAAPLVIDRGALDAFFAAADRPLADTLEAVLDLLPEGPAP